MKTKITTLIALFLLSLGVNAQIDRTKQPKAGPAPKINLGKPQTFELKNGLKVMVVENHKLPKVTASLILDNGPIFEDDKAGVSSIASGMMGNGTTSISKEAFVEEIDFLGASLNIGSQSASFNTLSKYFPRVLTLMADAVQNPLLTQEEFEKQQAQLLEGIKSGENSVGAVSGKVENALVYGKNHPYGEFETETTATNVSLEDVKQFYNNYFKPNNGYLVIIGDVNFKDVKKLVKKQFNNWEKGNLPEYTIPTVNNVAKTEINFVDMPNAVQSSVAVINTVDLKMGHPDYFATRLANKIFGGGGEGRLFLNLREDKGYTYGAYSSLGTDEKTSTKFKSSATVRNMVTDSSVVEFIKEIKNFRDTKVTEEELKNAKAAYVGNFVMAIERPTTVASYALNIVTKNLPEDFYETYLQKINDVTVDDVQRVAQKYFSADNARIVVVGKALDVLPNLEKLPYGIIYFDKEATKTSKPEMTKPIPAGVTKETVFNNFINAVGGDKIKEVTSVHNTAEATIQGMVLTMDSKAMAPNKQSVIVSGMGMTLSKMIFDGEKGYSEQQGVKTELAGKELEKMLNSTFPFPEVGYITDEKVSLEKIEPIDGSDAYVVKIGDDVTVYYNVATGLKLKQVTELEAGGQKMTQTMDFSDYKEVDGVKFPHSYKMTVGPQQFEFITKDIKLNNGVSESDFQ
ncbi:putative Zn-dependent peptidase [Lutibacter oceani]|uniref:Putative Zn-dependent peptidase n=1 Tax=Lutibacter oceani TaxID=1853311 RepID=A0A3D9RTS0_9FLAO|nr:insulinase family protein [Lutibacter oceani]REE83350.1 putative Zn-dependent peptidase [Lutibacter oceani]